MKFRIESLFLVSCLLAFCGLSLTHDLRAESPGSAAAVTVTADQAPTLPMAPTTPAEQTPGPAESAKRDEEDRNVVAAQATTSFLTRAKAMIADKASLLAKIELLNTETAALKADIARLRQSSNELAAIQQENADLKAAFAEMERKIEHTNAAASAEIASLGVPESRLPASAKAENSQIPRTQAELDAALEACGPDQQARFRILRAFRAEKSKARTLAAA